MTPAAPTVAVPTGAQVWAAGKAFSLVLPAGTFADPQGLPLHYAASQANGQTLPVWLAFNAATESFSGIAPATAQSLSIKVTATDTDGLSVAETFQASVTASAQTIAHVGKVTTSGETPLAFLLPATGANAVGPYSPAAGFAGFDLPAIGPADLGADGLAGVTAADGPVPLAVPAGAWVAALAAPELPALAATGSQGVHF